MELTSMSKLLRTCKYLAVKTIAIQLLWLIAGNLNAQNLKERDQTVFFNAGAYSIFSNGQLNTSPLSFTDGPVEFTYGPRFTASVYAHLRFRLKNRFLLETGLHAKRRTYMCTISSPELKYERALRISSYYFPLHGLIKVPTSDRAGIGGRFGIGFEYFPSQAGFSGDTVSVSFARNRNFMPCLDAGMFYELSTKGGDISFFAGYHRLLGRMGTLFFDYAIDEEEYLARDPLAGHYFSIGLGFVFKNQ